MKRPMSITVQGRSGDWSFDFSGDPAHLAEWRADGLQVDMLESSVPGWVVDLGLAKPWCAMASLWQWMRLW